MHYYKRNIGDYHKKAGRLSMLQHGAYTLLLDACYDREVFPTMEQALDWLWASSKEEIEAVEFVLAKFFTLEDSVYIQSRIQEDLEKYHETAKTNKRIAIERETKRREKRTKRTQDVNEAPPNHKPLTTNQEPITKVKDNAPSSLDYSKWPDLPQEQTLKDWLVMRKRLKANVNQTVINRLSTKLKQAVEKGYSVDECLAECIVRNWKGFDVEWLTKKDVYQKPNGYDRGYSIDQLGESFINGDD